eukprot:CFRG7987T1
MLPTPAHNNERLGDFLLGDCIGKGGFGAVYKALNTTDGSVVAVKKVKIGKMTKQKQKTIMGEIELLRTLKHPSIVEYRGYVRQGDFLNIILEYVENGSLQSIVKKFGQFPERLISVYIQQVLVGLVYLHDQGVIHRDIKGANILTTKAGTVKLADFGVATQLQDQEEGTVVGTPYWMAPEIIELAGAREVSDIWSVGCVVIELLTGNPPYFNLAPMPALFRIVQDDHPPLPSTVSPVLKDFLLQTFIKEPNMRVSAKKALRHPYIQNTHNNAKEIQSQVLENQVAAIKQYNDTININSKSLMDTWKGTQTTKGTQRKRAQQVFAEIPLPSNQSSDTISTNFSRRSTDSGSGVSNSSRSGPRNPRYAEPRPTSSVRKATAERNSRGRSEKLNGTQVPKRSRSVKSGRSTSTSASPRSTARKPMSKAPRESDEDWSGDFDEGVDGVTDKLTALKICANPRLPSGASKTSPKNEGQGNKWFANIFKRKPTNKKGIPAKGSAPARAGPSVDSLKKKIPEKIVPNKQPSPRRMKHFDTLRRPSSPGLSRFQENDSEHAFDDIEFSADFIPFSTIGLSKHTGPSIAGGTHSLTIGDTDSEGSETGANTSQIKRSSTLDRQVIEGIDMDDDGSVEGVFDLEGVDNLAGRLDRRLSMSTGVNKLVLTPVHAQSYKKHTENEDTDIRTQAHGQKCSSHANTTTNTYTDMCAQTPSRELHKGKWSTGYHSPQTQTQVSTQMRTHTNCKTTPSLRSMETKNKAVAQARALANVLSIPSSEDDASDDLEGLDVNGLTETSLMATHILPHASRIRTRLQHPPAHTQTHTKMYVAPKSRKHSSNSLHSYTHPSESQISVSSISHLSDTGSTSFNASASRSSSKLRSEPSLEQIPPAFNRSRSTSKGSNVSRTSSRHSGELSRPGRRNGQIERSNGTSTPTAYTHRASGAACVSASITKEWSNISIDNLSIGSLDRSNSAYKKVHANRSRFSDENADAGENDDDDFGADFCTINDASLFRKLELRKVFTNTSEDEDDNNLFDQLDTSDEDDPFSEIDKEEFAEYDVTEAHEREQTLHITRQVEMLTEKLETATDIEVEDVAEQLLRVINTHPQLCVDHIASHGLVRLVELLENSTAAHTYISSVLSLVNEIVTSSETIQESLSLIGVIPAITKFFDSVYSPLVQSEAARFVHHLCFTSPLSLQMFVACRGLPTLTVMLNAPITSCGSVVTAAVESLWYIFDTQSAATKNDFSRLLMRTTTTNNLVSILEAMSNNIDNTHKHMYTNNTTITTRTPTVNMEGIEHEGDNMDATNEILIERINKIVHTLVFFSLSDSVVKLEMCRQGAAAKLLLIAPALPPTERLLTVKCIKNLTTEATALDILENSEVVQSLIHMLQLGNSRHITASKERDINNNVLSALYNLCKVNKRRQELAAASGIIPILKQVIEENNPVKQLALPIICDIGMCSRKTRSELFKHDGVNLFSSLLQDPNFQATALDVLSTWLADTPHVVEPILCQANRLDMVTSAFGRAKSPYFDLMLEPMHRIVEFSHRINTQLAEGRLVKIIIKRLQSYSSRPNVVLALLKIIHSLFDASEDSYRFVSMHGIVEAVQPFTHNASVMVGEVTRQLLEKAELCETKSTNPQSKANPDRHLQCPSLSKSGEM